MTRLVLPLLGFGLGCTTSATSTDTADTGGVDTQESGPDTGTGFLMWHGKLQYDADEESLEATRGIAARPLLASDYLCDIYADYVSVGPGARGCPDCDYSFTTELVGGHVSGESCNRFLTPTLFDYFDYTDFYFGTYLDGLGWSDEYVYTYSTVEYLLTDVVWGHVSGSRYNGWYLYGYNFPSSASFNVVGDKYAATFERPIVNSSGSLTYYFFYY